MSNEKLVVVLTFGTAMKPLDWMGRLSLLLSLPPPHPASSSVATIIVTRAESVFILSSYANRLLWSAQRPRDLQGRRLKSLALRYVDINGSEALLLHSLRDCAND